MRPTARGDRKSPSRAAKRQPSTSSSRQHLNHQPFADIVRNTFARPMDESFRGLSPINVALVENKLKFQNLSELKGWLRSSPSRNARGGARKWTQDYFRLASARERKYSLPICLPLPVSFSRIVPPKERTKSWQGRIARGAGRHRPPSPVLACPARPRLPEQSGSAGAQGQPRSTRRENGP